MPSESSQDLLQKISSIQKNEKNKKNKKTSTVFKSIKAMKCRLWNKKNTKEKEGGKGKIQKYLTLKKALLRFHKCITSLTLKVVHNTTRIKDYANSNREMQTSSQGSTNLTEDLSDSGLHVTSIWE